jgi:hypothetical protein
MSWRIQPIDDEDAREQVIAMMQESALTREQARQIAMDRLTRLVGEEAMQRLALRGWVPVRGSAGGEYRVFARSHVGNIQKWDMRHFAWITVCCHLVSAGRCTIEENMAAQVLALMKDETRFLRLACIGG